MDLKNYLKEPVKFKSDLSWLDESTFDVEKNHRNPHECKDELNIQWGNEGYLIKPENNPILTKKANRKEEVQTNIVQLTRSLMNSGMKVSDIRDYLNKHQNPQIIKACSNEIERQLGLNGSVGRFVLDARGYKNCEEALKVASKNPFKKYMRYTIGCSCGEHIKTKVHSASLMISNGDPFGDVMNENNNSSSKIVESCPKTGMEILSGQGDLDEQWAGDTMIDVMNACGLDKEEGKALTASVEHPYIRLKRFFIALDNGDISKETEYFNTETKQSEDINSSPLSVKLEKGQNDIPVVLNDKSGQTIKLNNDAPISKPIDVDIDSVSFGLNKDIPKEKPLDGFINDNNVLIDGFEKDIETIPVEIPIPETNIFSLNNTENRDIPIDDTRAPLIIDVKDTDVIGDMEFGTPENDELFNDGMIQLEDDKKDDIMLFSF